MLLRPRLTPKVIAVKYLMPPRLYPYMPQKAADFHYYFGSDFMSIAKAETDRIWFVDQDVWRCLLILEVGFLEVEARRGWWVDFASIPGILESIEKRDDRTGLIAAILHDAFFEMSYPSYQSANSIFYQVMKLEGASSWTTWSRWRGVETSKGYDAWLKCDEEEHHQYASRWVTIREVPCVSPAFKHLEKL